MNRRAHPILPAAIVFATLTGCLPIQGRDAKHKSGRIALQHARGVKDDLQPIKFRKVEIRPL